MAALIRRKQESDNTRDEIPPGTLYLLIMKALSRRGKLHGYEIAEAIQSFVWGPIARILPLCKAARFEKGKS